MLENKSIEELENDYWADTVYPTGLVERCHLYRKIPIKDLTIEQLRILIGQQIGLEYLLSQAFVILNLDILAEGDLYAGDLLSAVLNVKFWNDPDLKEKYKQMLRKKLKYLSYANQNNDHSDLIKQIHGFL